MEQYSYKSKDKIITVEDGDICIDAGACWGDTALYFASKAGLKGKVYTFEFVESSKKILNYNVSLNPHLKDNIELISNPVFDEDDVEISFIDNGPGTFISTEKINGNVSIAKTKKIDTLVAERNIPRIDFIKMDIEGAELKALHGSENTIKKFKPKLAICVYHDNKDFTEILNYIDCLNLGYKFYLGHYTIMQFETVLYATVK